MKVGSEGNCIFKGSPREVIVVAVVISLRVPPVCGWGVEAVVGDVAVVWVVGGLVEVVEVV